jgi:hypothetical protein
MGHSLEALLSLTATQPGTSEGIGTHAAGLHAVPWTAKAVG